MVTLFNRVASLGSPWVRAPQQRARCPPTTTAMGSERLIRYPTSRGFREAGADRVGVEIDLASPSGCCSHQIEQHQGAKRPDQDLHHRMPMKPDSPKKTTSR
jgi:hypothetical protein